MVEQRRFQPALWNGIECCISAAADLELINFLESQGQPEYEAAVRRILARSQESVAAITSFNIFDPAIPIQEFTLRLAVLPRHQFEPILFQGMPNPQDWAWAKVCVREFEGRHFVVYDSSIADASWESRNTMAADQLRENIHELWHPFMRVAVPPGIADTGKKGSIAFREFTAEAMPRILLDLQHQMPESTQFLLSLNSDDVLPFGVVDREGWGRFPSLPLRENPVYGGIFLAGIAVADRLGDGDLKQGVAEFVRTGQRCDNPDQLWESLNGRGIDKNWLLETTEPMKRGQELLSDYLLR